MQRHSLHVWQWHEWQGLPYLRCSLLAEWSHGFFTQQCWPRSPLDLVPALDAMAPVFRVKQVHGNTVLPTGELEPLRPEVAWETLPPADGIVAGRSRQSVWTCTADCTPVLLADGRTGQVAVVHAGWRGTAAKIVPEAVALLLAQGSQLADLRAALGPAIAGEVYELEAELALQILSSVLPEAGDERVAIAERLAWVQALPRSPLHASPNSGKVGLHVRQVSAMQLERLGLGPEQVAVSPHCTFQEETFFFSHRRNPQKKVQWSGIVSA